MTHDPEKPLLRLNDPRNVGRRKGSGGGGNRRKFPRTRQTDRFGPRFQRLQETLNRPDGALQLRSDPSALAPERLLVFETTGSVSNFYAAVSKVEGLEFVAEQAVNADEEDANPEHYILMPNEASLNQILSLWNRWEKGEALPRGFTPWREVFLSLKEIRPWGPSDRVSQKNRQILENSIDGLAPDEVVRIELELVYRRNERAAQRAKENVEVDIILSLIHI